MNALSISDAAMRFGGTLLNPDASFERVCIDSRKVEGGDLFVALPGQHHDGHDFIGQIADKISAAVVTRRCAEVDITQWVVDDTERALGNLAKMRRERFSGPVIAITGSSGKTSVKEYVAAILTNSGAVHATVGNYNNHIGLPLTLLDLPPESDFLVLEMGASGAGDIAYLCTVGRPSIALVNNIQSAHMAGFGSLTGTASAKAEVYSGLPTDGIAILNLDSDYSDDWRELIGARRCLTFSVSDRQADLCAVDLKINDNGCYDFDLLINMGHTDATIRCSISLLIPGRHAVANALAAAACALAAGATKNDIATGLNTQKALAGRLHEIALDGGGRAFDDTYNASPESSMAAIDVLARCAGRRILVLGDMAELGSQSAQLHRSVGDYARRSGVDELLTLGSQSVAASDAFGGKHFVQLADLGNYLNTLGDTSTTTFMVKGSRSSAMERVIEVLSRRGNVQC
ncbi:MAG: UDP-N-acetylmuramoyl-tripeptide--D-alanyl-D-alanine ligase [Cellvibrionales bacterium]